VGAADYIENNHLDGPLFNAYSWGGYLMWRLPWLPVSIDGRTNLYGPAALARRHNTMNAGPGWAHDPTLRAAHLVLIAPDDPFNRRAPGPPLLSRSLHHQLSVLFVPQGHCSAGGQRVS